MALHENNDAILRESPSTIDVMDGTQATAHNDSKNVDFAPRVVDLATNEALHKTLRWTSGGPKLGLTIKRTYTSSVAVSSVDADSCAANAGLRVGDIIHVCNGHQVSGKHHAYELITRKLRSDGVVHLGITREREAQNQSTPPAVQTSTIVDQDAKASAPKNSTLPTFLTFASPLATKQPKAEHQNSKRNSRYGRQSPVRMPSDVKAFTADYKVRLHSGEMERVAAPKILKAAFDESTDESRSHEDSDEIDTGKPKPVRSVSFHTFPETHAPHIEMPIGSDTPLTKCLRRTKNKSNKRR